MVRFSTRIFIPKCFKIWDSHFQRSSNGKCYEFSIISKWQGIIYSIILLAIPLLTGTFDLNRDALGCLWIIIVNTYYELWP